MSEPVGIAVTGASGRMGRMLIRAVEETPGAKISGVTERPGHDWIGRDLGEALGGAPTWVTVSDDPLEVFARSQAVLDFTAPAATVAYAELAAQARLVHVIGTTGLEREDLEKIARRRKADYLVYCRAGKARTAREFAATSQTRQPMEKRLLLGNEPAWLERLSASSDLLKVYRIR